MVKWKCLICGQKQLIPDPNNGPGNVRNIPPGGTRPGPPEAYDICLNCAATVFVPYDSAGKRSKKFFLEHISATGGISHTEVKLSHVKAGFNIEVAPQVTMKRGGRLELPVKVTKAHPMFSENVDINVDPKTPTNGIDCDLIGLLSATPDFDSKLEINVAPDVLPGTKCQTAIHGVSASGKRRKSTVDIIIEPAGRELSGKLGIEGPVELAGKVGIEGPVELAGKVGIEGPVEIKELKEADFRVVVSDKRIALNPGQSRPVPFIVESIGGFSEAVHLTLSTVTPAPGIICRIVEPPPMISTPPFKGRVLVTAAPGTGPTNWTSVSVTGTSPTSHLSRSDAFEVKVGPEYMETKTEVSGKMKWEEVEKSAFEIVVSPSEVTLGQGDSTNVMVSVNYLRGLAEDVKLDLGNPTPAPGVHAYFGGGGTHETVTPSAPDTYIQVRIDADGRMGTHEVTINGKSLATGKTAKAKFKITVTKVEKPPEVTLHGYVRDEVGDPLDGVSITAGTKSTTTPTTHPGTSGVYRIEKADRGSYIIKAELPAAHPKKKMFEDKAEVDVNVPKDAGGLMVKNITLKWNDDYRKAREEFMKEYVPSTDPQIDAASFNKARDKAKPFLDALGLSSTEIAREAGDWQTKKTGKHARPLSKEREKEIKKMVPKPQAMRKKFYQSVVGGFGMAIAGFVIAAILGQPIFIYAFLCFAAYNIIPTPESSTWIVKKMEDLRDMYITRAGEARSEEDRTKILDELKTRLEIENIMSDMRKEGSWVTAGHGNLVLKAILKAAGFILLVIGVVYLNVPLGGLVGLGVGLGAYYSFSLSRTKPEKE